jgi:hypothetical protein
LFGGGGGGNGGFGTSEIFGGGGGGGGGSIGLLRLFAVIFGGGGGGGIDFFVCEKAFAENNITKANKAAQKVNFPIDFFSEMPAFSFSINIHAINRSCW